MWSCFHHNSTRQLFVVLLLNFATCFYYVGTCAFVQAFLGFVIINSTEPSELNHVGVPECHGSMYPLVGCFVVVVVFFLFFFLYWYFSICQKEESFCQFHLLSTICNCYFPFNPQYFLFKLTILILSN